MPWGPIALALTASIALTAAYVLSQPAVCGDGHLGGEEQCDDGNRIDGDGCDFLCRTETTPQAPKPPTQVSSCGNGQVEPGEACDDGNTAPDDGCTPDCHLPGAFPPSDDAGLLLWTEEADLDAYDQLFQHLEDTPAWLQGMRPDTVRTVVNRHLALPFESLHIAGSSTAVAPLLSALPQSLTCREARGWLGWAEAEAATTQTPVIQPFYQRWCTICTARWPELALKARGCRKRADDGYIFADGRCLHVDSTPYLQGCVR